MAALALKKCLKAGQIKVIKVLSVLTKLKYLSKALGPYVAVFYCCS